MKAVIEPGCYVVAVSGGVDSMVLLDLLTKAKQLKLVVAHFDHGIRDDAVADRRLVQAAAQRYGLQFVYDNGQLGADASEARARQARYDFLHAVRVSSNAQAIITAHHQDDMLETAIINIIRGTGRKGLSSLTSGDRVLRPLLGYTKQQIQKYAEEHRIDWHEDKTNKDEKYLRNYVRNKILNKLSISDKKKLRDHLDNAKQLNDQIDSLLAVQLHLQTAPDKLDRAWFISLPHGVSREVMASWLRGHELAFDRKSLQRLVVAAKTYTPGKQTPVTKEVTMHITAGHLALEGLDR